jgi:hypothetical protein
MCPQFAVVRCDGKVEAKALTILDEPLPDAEEIAAREVPPDSPAEDPAVRQLRREAIVGFRSQWAGGLVGILLGAGVIALSVAPFQLAWRRGRCYRRVRWARGEPAAPAEIRETRGRCCPATPCNTATASCG